MTRGHSLTNLAVAGVALVLTSGCLVGPDYKRPQLPAPDQYRFVESPEQAAAAADLFWWQVFEDPTLQALTNEAIANNLDLKIAAARVEEARARAGIAKSFMYPQVDGVAGYGVRQASNTPATEENPNGDSVNQSGSYGFRLAWELDVFGRIRRQNEAAYAVFLASEQARRGVMVTLVADVATSYFLLRELDAQLQLSHETLRLNDETVAYFRNRLEGGVSNRLELDQAIANRQQTAATIPDIEQQIGTVENGIAMLLGRLPGPVTRPAAASMELPPPIPVGLPATLLERRPDVVGAEEMLVAANADVGAAKALFYPSISLTGFFGGVSGDLTTFLGGEGAIWSIGAGLLQPIYNGNRNRRNYEAAQAAFHAAVAEYQKAALNGYREVSNALITIQKLAQIRLEVQVAVTALQDAADLSRSRYDSGLANYLEIILADQALFRQQLLLAQTRGAELRARAELYRTLGGGWQVR
ncbi:MAG TPA: efflux transporter outer membrane subunit [Vicinamibacterales bacterium]|nr:efflux transporter outer membrane subunit [Vicinamibacterales bacterium]